MDERIQKYDAKMTKTIASLETEFATIRAGRASPQDQIPASAFYFPYT